VEQERETLLEVEVKSTCPRPGQDLEAEIRYLAADAMLEYPAVGILLHAAAELLAHQTEVSLSRAGS
jgi:hypothetical protein